MRAIFNSVGSNYSYGFALKAFFSRSRANNQTKLIDFLQSRYSGEAHLFYKGREAIQAALVIADLPKNTKVLITGYTCYAVYKAVVDADCVPVFVDIAPKQLNFNGDTLTKALKKHSDAKVVILQNTLGYPSDIATIQKIVKANKLLVIEDLAHCIGMKYADGKEAGTIGDFTALSFSQDKVVDGISGGALVVRNEAHKSKFNHKIAYTKLPHKQQIRDRIYPLLTVKIRALYPFGLGKPLHALCKKLHLLAKPVDGIFGVYRELPDWYAGLIHDRFQDLINTTEHRTTIGKIYEREISKRYQMTSTYGVPTMLRFPMLVKDRDALFAYFKKSNVFITDIWYETPIAPVRYLKKTTYKNGECPEADQVAELMVNLPIHTNVREADAEMIARKVNTWLSSAEK